MEQRLEQDWLQAHADSFEGYLDRIDAVADDLGKGPPDEQSSHLRQMVQDLRQVSLLGFMLQADCAGPDTSGALLASCCWACDLRNPAEPEHPIQG